MNGKRMTFTILAMIVIGVILIAGCTQPSPPATATPTPTITPAPKTIVETAIADGRFNTLVSAVQAANLVGTLNSAGPFTVFAPTDNAFNNLPPGTVATLLKEPEGQLKQILLYHVISGNYNTDQLVQMKTVQTVQGATLSFKEMNGTVMVNDAKIIIPNIKASNGMVQVIDAVLLPP